MQFKTQFADKPDFGSFEAFTKPSMTEPDNTMSIPEIIARYTRGQGLGVNVFPWQAGVAGEEGEGEQHDASLEQVLELQQNADPEPTSSAAAPVDPDPAAAPAPQTPAPAGA
jgi:hypothetical protein